METGPKLFKSLSFSLDVLQQVYKTEQLRSFWNITQKIISSEEGEVEQKSKGGVQEVEGHTGLRLHFICPKGAQQDFLFPLPHSQMTLELIGQQPESDSRRSWEKFM